MRFSEIERTDRQIPLVLKLTAGGLPVKWIHYKDAVVAHWNNKVLWHLGEEIPLRGGKKADGSDSIFMLPSIIACDEEVKTADKVPTLTNVALFKRDNHQCQYCGDVAGSSKLTRDHIVPTSKGGKNAWTNCATACVRCNHAKGSKTLEELGWQLLAVPYVPSLAEKLLLENRRVIADQSEYLRSMIPKDSPYWKRHVN